VHISAKWSNLNITTAAAATTTTPIPTPTNTTTPTTTAKDNGVTTLTFRGHVTLSITWRYRSRDHLTHGGRLPMGGP